MGLSTVGGGLTNGKLSLANAATSDVLQGKTFYSGDKTLKTGSMPNRGSWGTTLEPGNSVKVPQGYHNGNGTVAATGIRHATFYVGGPVDATAVSTVYLSSQLPYSVYSKLTLNNIIVEPNNWLVRWGEDGDHGSHATALNKQYNPSTGILTFHMQGNAGIYDLGYGADSCTVHVFY